MRSLTILAAACALLVGAGLVAATTESASVEVTQECGDTAPAGPPRTRRYVSRNTPDELRTPPPSVVSPPSPVAPLEQYSVADLVIAAARDREPSGNQSRPTLTEPERDAAWEELLARDETALAEVVEIFLHGSRINDRDAAREVLVRMGARAVPVVIGLLRSDDRKVREEALYLLFDLAEDPCALGVQRHEVLDALANAADHADRETARDAEEVFAELAGCLPFAAARLAHGDESQRLSALRVLGDIEDEHQAAQALALVESTARDPHETQAVRDAAAFRLVCNDDLDGPARSVPDPAGLPNVRLWALALWCDENGCDDESVAVLLEHREAAVALFVDTAYRGRDPDAVEWAIDTIADVAVDPVPLLLEIAASAETAAARELAIDEIARCSEAGRLGTYGRHAAAMLMVRLGDPDEDIQHSAAAAVARLGTDGAAVLPGLLRALDDPARALMAAYTLETMGTAAAAAADRLVEVVHDPSRPPALRIWALDALHAIDAVRAAPAARTLLSSPSPEMRWSAARTLLEDAEDSAATRAAALTCLEDPNAEVRRVGATCLQRCIEPSAETCAAAVAALDDPDPEVRRALLWFLVRADTMDLAECAERAVPALMRLLDDADEDDVAWVVRALVDFDDAARPAIPKMIAALHDRNGRPRFDVATALSYFREDAQPARPIIVDWWRRGLDTERGEVLDALERLEWTPTPADFPRLLALIHAGAGHDSQMWEALDVLERAGPSAATTVPHLLAAARGSTGWRRSEVVETLGYVSSAEPDVIAFLIEEVRSGERHDGGCCNPSWYLPADAAEALGRIGSRASSAVPALADLTSDPERWVRRKAVEALRAITSREPVLADTLPDTDERWP